jgi:hypothetical protein
MVDVGPGGPLGGGGGGGGGELWLGSLRFCGSKNTYCVIVAVTVTVTVTDCYIVGLHPIAMFICTACKVFACVPVHVCSSFYIHA